MIPSTEAISTENDVQCLYIISWSRPFESVLCYERWSVGQSIWEWSTHLGLTTRFLLLSDSCGFLDVGRTLWWEDGSVVYNCCWPSPAQSFSGPSPMGLMTYFTVSDFPFHHLIWLAGLRWRYLTLPPLGILKYSQAICTNFIAFILCHFQGNQWKTRPN
jgi:hypothetical protein